MEKYIEKQVEEKEFIDRLHQKAERILSEYAISMDDFIYEKEIIEKDKTLVNTLKAKFKKDAPNEEKEAKVLADILEAIILEESESSNWLGQNASTIKVSEYDDYVNHIDTIIEFEDAETASHTALGIDATYSTSIKEKFDRIKEEIKNGVLAEAKYFSSSSIKGMHIQIPRLIIGAEVKTIKELGELWLDKDSRVEGRKKEVKKALENHPAQFQILRQMLLEAEVFEKYAQKVNQQKIAETYARLKKLVQKIYDNKNPNQNDKGDYDNMIDIIKNNLKSFE
ncbi:MAG: hypothetical protein US71_C0009G0002 [Parcubacteria group bacterium GW2011_GWD2_38_12]|uniref:Uncharacterized protein n=1 Tax=Candidatus Azambacteria bacterium RIFCSPLOWO2_01_FULL_37_9 TaxID=1797297 RepID=A0A1F5C6R2_9BACT|nr:MAG: hypothetical protein US06_C0011G0002 [Parcubacteria group bacterium GW2011_GWC2_36_17]KKQ38985.1 MAG: hypothetical protein US56_C0030G0001 [Candidatus Moranbacteria bacterium GW2011_GWF2_37_7]KKQ43791.1 MAG: hypothetical protein US61_C0003G0001 [Parcubacteria group bacterium GW2011_GWE2_37_8]KKQ51635.1 MAG: hypothetical protein US71_C0009G0002 [Parcubacteria group bacterium GW2011_GWD2_38_12]KKQ58734.1 MAG: hypothetical protein US79_C0003G0035 [Parcubacteria group bacterium GW2011_GWC1_